MKRALHTVNIDIRENLFALEFMNDNKIVFRMRCPPFDCMKEPIDDYERTDRDPAIAIKLFREIEREVKAYVGRHKGPYALLGQGQRRGKASPGVCARRSRPQPSLIGLPSIKSPL